MSPWRMGIVATRSVNQSKRDHEQCLHFYSGVRGEDELHEDKMVNEPADGQVMECAGEYCKIVGIQTVTVASNPERIDVVKGSISGLRRKTYSLLSVTH
jgi:hypothetical protein